MGLFRKKSPEELLAEGRAAYQSGDWVKVNVSLHGLGKQKHPEACYYLGQYWLHQKETKTNLSIAKDYLTTAAEQGYPDAIALLREKFGVSYESKTSQPAQAPQKTEDPFDAAMAAYRSKDYPGALKLFLRAAELGDAAAQFNCGLLYDHGRGAPKDPATALDWFEKAAGQGHAKAQYFCGKMYASGTGAAQDFEKARLWLQRSADQGNADAAEELTKLPAPQAEEELPLDFNEETETEPEEEPKEELKEESEEEPKEESKEASVSEAEKLYAEGMAAIGTGDFAKALDLFLKSAEMGSEKAQKVVDLMRRRAEALQNEQPPAEPAEEPVEEPAAEGEDLNAESAEFYEESDGEPDKEPDEEPDKESDEETFEESQDEMRRQREIEKMISEGDVLDPAITSLTLMGKRAYNAGNYTKALKLFQQAAVKNSVVAQIYCGELYEKGLGTQANKKKAFRWYERAASLFDKDAQKEAERLRKELGLPDQSEARALHKKGLNAQGYGKNAEALELYLQAAQKGYADSQFCCGDMYKNGTGIAVDKEKALYWYEKAAQQENIDAQFNCGWMYLNGIGTKKNLEKALMWFERAAEWGMDQAQMNCGLMYINGDGTAVDKEKGFRWMEKAAEQGNAVAQCNCGILYRDGCGVKADKVKAVQWFEQSAEQGYLDAQLCYGNMYVPYENTGVDREKAFAWLDKAAEQGNKLAKRIIFVKYCPSEKYKD